MCSPADNASPAVTEKHKHLKIETSLTARLSLDLDWESEDLRSVPGSAASWGIKWLTTWVCPSIFSLFAYASPAVTGALLSNTPSVVIS